MKYFLVGLLFGLVVAMCLTVGAYDRVPPIWVCCIKEKNGVKEEILVDPEELGQLKSCGLIKNRAKRSACARRYTNPWEQHHHEANSHGVRV